MYNPSRQFAVYFKLAFGRAISFNIHALQGQVGKI